MRRSIAYLAALLVALGGCSRPAEEADPAGTSAATASAPSNPGGSGVPTEPGATTVPRESDGGDGSGGDGGGSDGGGGDGGGGDGDSGSGGGEDERDLEIAGPTLDNTFPTNPFALPEAGGTSCVLFTNPRADTTVTIGAVRLVDQQPSGEPGLVLGDDPSADGQCRPGHPSYPEELEQVHRTCDGAELKPQQRTGCPVQVRSIGSVGTDYTAILVLQLTATCTSLAGEPCARLTGRADPTAADPVTVTWTDTRRYCSCLVPREREAGTFLPGEGEGRCPPVPSPSAETQSSPDPEPGSGPVTTPGRSPHAEQPDSDEEGQPSPDDGVTPGAGPTTEATATPGDDQSPP